MSEKRLDLVRNRRRRGYIKRSSCTLKVKVLVESPDVRCMYDEEKEEKGGSSTPLFRRVGLVSSLNWSS